VESPAIVFDHIEKVTHTAPSAAKLAEIAAAQQQQVTTASGSPARG
jgi:hypothetical protein